MIEKKNLEIALEILRARGEEYRLAEATYDMGFAYSNAASILEEAIAGNYEVLLNFVAASPYFKDTLGLFSDKEEEKED